MTLTDSEVEAIIKDIEYNKSDVPTSKAWIFPSGKMIYLDRHMHHGSILGTPDEYNKQFWEQTIALKRYGALRIYMTNKSFDISASIHCTPTKAQIKTLKEELSKKQYEFMEYDIYEDGDVIESKEIIATLLSLQKFLRRLEELKDKRFVDR